AQVALLGSPATSYSDTGLSAGTTYYYEVVATNSAGDSGPSNVASATTTQPAQPPAAPTGLTATAASSSQNNLTWADNSNNESGVTVHVSTDGDSFGAVGTLRAWTTP